MLFISVGPLRPQNKQTKLMAKLEYAMYEYMNRIWSSFSATENRFHNRIEISKWRIKNHIESNFA